MSNPLVDMEKPEVIFAIGTNMTECHPVAATRLKKAINNGAKLIVADPRRIGLADISDLYLPLRVGSDAALLLAMAHVIAREGLVDADFIANRTLESEAFLEHIKQFTPEWAAKITELPPEDIEKAAIMYGRANKGAIYYTLGITEHISGVDNVQSLSNLALMTGHIGREGTGINPMRGQNNVQGAGDSGAMPNNYPGFQSVTDPANQAKFKELYGRETDIKVGINKVAAFERMGDEIHALFIDGENTLMSDPDLEHTTKALKSLDFMVVADIFLTETAEMADVVLPATSWAETDGVFTNTERRVQRVRQAVPSPGMAKPDWWIISEVAKRLNFQGFEYSHASEVFNELCSVAPIYAGLDWDRIDRGEFQWPVPDKDHAGTPRLHEGSFPSLTGRGLFKRINYRDPAETINEAYPVWLTTGRRLNSYHTHTQTGRTEGIEYLLPEEVLEVNPQDVADWGLRDGGYCHMSTPRGRIKIKIQANGRSPRNTVFTSFAFSDTPVNILTGSGYDPITSTAEVKVCAVKLEPA